MAVSVARVGDANLDSAYVPTLLLLAAGAARGPDVRPHVVRP